VRLKRVSHSGIRLAFGGIVQRLSAEYSAADRNLFSFSLAVVQLAVAFEL
jgi:hypothetical protein